MLRVIVTYPGFNAELEEELYFATRRRPDQRGQNIVKPEVPAEQLNDGRIHYPETVGQHQSFLSYTCQNEADAEALAYRFGQVVEGHGAVKVIDDRPKDDPAAEAPAIAEEPAAEAPAIAEPAAVEAPGAITADAPDVE